MSSYDGTKITNLKPITDLDSQKNWTKSDHDLWFGAGNNAGVYRFDGQNLNYLAFPIPKNINPKNTYHVTNISKGKNGMIWFATYAGIFGYNGKQFTIINDETLGIKKETDRLHIRSILEDSQGRLWFGNNGIGVILKNGDSVIQFSKEQGKLVPMIEFEANTKNKQFAKNTGLQSVFAIEEDGAGNIWFGDRDSGVWKYDGKTLKNYTIDDKLSSKMVWCIYKDKNNNVLFGTSNGGVYQFNGKSFDKQF